MAGIPGIEALTDALGGLTKDIKGMMSPLALLAESFGAIDKLSGVLARTGNTQKQNVGNLQKQFRETGTSFQQQVGILETSLDAGIGPLTKSQAKLTGKIALLGLKTGLFIKDIAKNTQVLGLTTAQSEGLAETFINVGRQYGMNSNDLVQAMDAMRNTTKKASLAYGSDVGVAFQEGAAQLIGILGPQNKELVSGFMGEFAGTNTESFNKLAKLGLDANSLFGENVKTGGDARDAMGEVSKRIVEMANGFFGGKIPSDPRLLEAFETSFGVGADHLQLARRMVEEQGNGFADLNTLGAQQADTETKAMKLSASMNEIINKIREVMTPMALSFTQWLIPQMGDISKWLTKMADQALAMWPKIANWIGGVWDSLVNKVYPFLSAWGTKIYDYFASGKALADVKKLWTKAVSIWENYVVPTLNVVGGILKIIWGTLKMGFNSLMLSFYHLADAIPGGGNWDKEIAQTEADLVSAAGLTQEGMSDIMQGVGADGAAEFYQNSAKFYNDAADVQQKQADQLELIADSTGTTAAVANSPGFQPVYTGGSNVRGIG